MDESTRPLLTNRCDYSAAHLTEALQHQLLQTQKRKILLLLGLILLVVIYALVRVSQGDKSAFMFLFLALMMLAIMAYANFGMPAKAAKAQVKALLERNGSTELSTRFLEDGVSISNARGEDTPVISYNELEKTIRSKSLWLIFTSSKQMMLLDPARFEPGGEAAFLALAGERFPHAAPKTKNET
jgi:type II secretory pathway component PulM